MSIFSETIKKAIKDYRTLLRRHLSQPERMARIQKLQLKNAATYSSDLNLYHTAIAIVEDIKENMVDINGKSHYAYSGVEKFATSLEKYLSAYSVENDQVVHRTRKASRALLEAIQITALPKERLDESIAKNLFDCNQVVAGCGSEEQVDLYVQTLDQKQAQCPGFYTRIMAHFESLYNSRTSVAA